MKPTIKLILLISFVSITYAAPIKITADKVTIQEAGTSIYEGNARLTQGKDTLEADKIIINHQNNKIKSVQLIGEKTQAHLLFYNNDGQSEAWADEIDYHPKSKQVTLKINAKLKQQDNIIQAEFIEFNQETREIIAKSNNKSQVETQFEDGE